MGAVSFKVGDRVKVVRVGNYEHLEVGMVGTVAYTEGDCTGVYFPNWEWGHRGRSITTGVGHWNFWPGDAEKIELCSPTLDTQVGGDHYTKMAIQPLEYILANNLPFPEGSVIKYVSRWRSKGGVQDLKKARDFLDKLIAHEEKATSIEEKA